MQRDRRRAARLIARNWRHCRDSTTSAGNMQQHDATGKTKRLTFRMKNITGLRTKLKRTSHHVRNIPKSNFIPYPDKVIQRGQESYAYIANTKKMGDRCMVQRCYVMMGGLESEQYLQFRSLRHLVEMESRVCCTTSVLLFLVGLNNMHLTLTFNVDLPHSRRIQRIGTLSGTSFWMQSGQ